ncbi:hypothetical protein BH11PSE11_BH11PSE11_30560 [soil metagenome]
MLLISQNSRGRLGSRSRKTLTASVLAQDVSSWSPLLMAWKLPGQGFTASEVELEMYALIIS